MEHLTSRGIWNLPNAPSPIESESCLVGERTSDSDEDRNSRTSTTPPRMETGWNTARRLLTDRARARISRRRWSPFDQECQYTSLRSPTLNYTADTGTVYGILPDSLSPRRGRPRFVSGYTEPQDLANHGGPTTCTTTCGPTEETDGLTDTIPSLSQYLTTSSMTSSQEEQRESPTPYYSRFATDTLCRSQSREDLWLGSRELSFSPVTGSSRSCFSDSETLEHSDDDFMSCTTPEWEHWSSLMSNSSNLETSENEI